MLLRNCLAIWTYKYLILPWVNISLYNLSSKNNIRLCLWRVLWLHIFQIFSVFIIRNIWLELPCWLYLNHSIVYNVVFFVRYQAWVILVFNVHFLTIAYTIICIAMSQWCMVWQLFSYDYFIMIILPLLMSSEKSDEVIKFDC